MNSFIIRFFLKNKVFSDTHKKKKYLYNLEAFFSVLINTILFVVKLILGIITGSVALISDAVHSFSDTFSSLIVFFSAWFSSLKPDKEHPFGHQRIESVSTLIIAMILFMTAIELIKNSIGLANQETPLILNKTIFTILFVTILLKIWLFFFSLKISRKTHSHLLKAEAFHHLSDCITTLIVLASITIPLFVKIPFNIDAAAGMIVSGFIIYSAYEITKSSLTPLLGEAATETTIQSIKQIVLKEKQVVNCHDITIHKYGQVFFTSLDAEFSAETSFLDVHRACDRIEKNIYENLSIYATIHPDPVNLNDPLLNRIKNYLSQIISEIEEGFMFHEARLVEKKEKYILFFDLDSKKNVPLAQKKKKSEYLKQLIKMKFPEIQAVSITIDPLFVNQ